MTTKRKRTAILTLAALSAAHAGVLLAADKQINPLLAGAKLGTVAPLTDRGFRLGCADDRLGYLS